MELDQLVEALNKKENVSSITVNNLDQTDLTEEQKTFIKTYQPEKALIIYGTLAPGRSNHHMVEPINGQWRKGTVRGKLVHMGWGADQGYKGFMPAQSEQQDNIPADLLFSDELEVNWKRLDEFEGNGYRRILAKYELENGEVGVGYIYAINE